MWTDRKVKEELERCVATACLVAQLDPRDYPVRLMGKKKQDKKYSLVASDEIHPGTSFHDFWSDFMYSKYVESK